MKTDKKQYAADICLCCACTVLWLPVSALFSYIFSNLTHSFSMTETGKDIAGVAVSVLSTLAVSLFLILITKTNVKSCLTPWREEKAEYLPFMTLRGMELLIFMKIICSYIVLIFERSGVVSAVAEGGTASPMPATPTGALIMALESLFVGFSEELLFRGLMMRRLMKYGGLTAAVLSSLMFASLHGAPLQICLAFLAGMLFSYYDMKYGSIKVGVILHALNNYTAMLYATLEAHTDEESYALTMLTIWLIIIFFGFLAKPPMRYFDKKFGRKKVFCRGDGDIPAKSVLLISAVFLLITGIVIYFLRKTLE